jgi:cytochrome c biogenesis protein CcmG/thiol:disulfide interchange protein DsbE
VAIATDTDSPQPTGRRLTLGSVVLLIGILSVIGVMGIQLVRQNQSQPESGNRAPDFTVATFDSETFTLSEHRGEIVVINFWGSWCPPCRNEAPHLETVYQEYKDQGVTFIGITHIDEVADSLAFIDEFGISYMNAPDQRSGVADKYAIRGVPETFVVGRDGRIVEGGALLTEINASILRRVLNQALMDDSEA